MKTFINQSVQNATWRFLESLGTRPFPVAAIDCTRAAFALYNQEWDCHPHHIEKWEWPINEAHGNGNFDGDEPWTVLLRHAVQLIRSRDAVTESSPQAR